MESTPREIGFSDLTASVFRRIILALTIFFLAVETLCVLRFPLVMDEFVDAVIVWRMASKLPYRDLPLGKTVLAYYLQLPVLVTFGDAWRALLAVKLEMAILSAGAICYAAFAMARDFSRTAVAIGFVTLVTMNTFFERATEFRSDMPTAIAGLIALLLLMRRRPAWSGFWSAIALMMSQKAAYYVLASEAALLVAICVYRRRNDIRDLLAYNATAAATFTAYLLFWMALSSPHEVLFNTFLAQQTNAFGIHFIDIRSVFWLQTLRRNPAFYALAASALPLLALRARARRDERALLLFVYGSALWALSIWHRQPWPYFFVLLIPFLFVVQVPLIEHVISTARQRHRQLFVAVVLIAAAVSLVIRLPALLARSNDFQLSMFRLGEHILRSGGEYFAAVPIFYRNRQPVEPYLESVDTVQRELLLRLPPERVVDMVRSMDREPVRFIVFTYRIDSLPILVRQYLVATFEPYWGAVFIYSPKLRSGMFNLHFTAEYVIETSAPGVAIDGRPYAAGARVRLTRGTHVAASETMFRLRLNPAGVTPYLDVRHQGLEDFFPDVYTF